MDSISQIFQVLNVLGLLFYVAIPACVVVGIFFREQKKLFWFLLSFVAVYVYAWVTLSLVASHYGPGPFAGPTHSVTVPYAPFLEAVRATLFFLTLYSGIGLVVTLIRTYRQYASTKSLYFFVSSLVIGLAGLWIFYILPCDLSPDGCAISEPYIPSELRPGL